MTSKERVAVDGTSRTNRGLCYESFSGEVVRQPQQTADPSPPLRSGRDHKEGVVVRTVESPANCRSLGFAGDDRKERVAGQCFARDDRKERVAGQCFARDDRKERGPETASLGMTGRRGWPETASLGMTGRRGWPDTAALGMTEKQGGGLSTTHADRNAI